MKWIRKFREEIETGKLTSTEGVEADCADVFLELPDGTWLKFHTSEWGRVKIVPANEVPRDSL